MKKAIKLISLLLTMVLALSLFSGCVVSSEAPEEEPVLDITVGIPCSMQDPEFEEWKPILQYWMKDFAEYYNFNLSVVSVPKDADEMDDFISNVKKGKVAIFFAEEGDYIDEMIEEEALISIEEIRASFATFKTEHTNGVWNISAASDQVNYMIPYAGTYQGLFINSDLFTANGVAEPTDWKSFIAAIDAFKAKGITPIAAGYADQGLEYLVDDMILSEGGTAEHSFMPSFGVVSSWERAAKDIIDLNKRGAFTADCFNVSYETAKQDFLNGEAAMIFAPMADVVSMSESVKAVPLAATPTGKRESGAFIGNFKGGAYISAKYFNQTEERYSKMLIELLGTYYGADGAFVDLLVDDGELSAVGSYYYAVDTSTLGESVSAMLEASDAADRPMRTHAKAMDTIVDGFRKALTGTDLQEALMEATKAEVSAGKKG